MGNGGLATKDSSAYIRKRIYWKTSDGFDHGFIKKESGSSLEVYSYNTGQTLSVARKDVAKVVTEEL